jgi:hypothetical protein
MAPKASSSVAPKAERVSASVSASAASASTSIVKRADEEEEEEETTTEAAQAPQASYIAVVVKHGKPQVDSSNGEALDYQVEVKFIENPEGTPMTEETEGQDQYWIEDDVAEQLYVGYDNEN